MGLRRKGIYNNDKKQSAIVIKNYFYIVLKLALTHFHFFYKISFDDIIFYLTKKKKTSIIENKLFSFKRLGASPSGKAAVFGTAIRRFESFRPSIT